MPPQPSTTCTDDSVTTTVAGDSKVTQVVIKPPIVPRRIVHNRQKSAANSMDIVNTTKVQPIKAPKKFTLVSANAESKSVTFADQTSENEYTAELESPFLTGENQVCTGLNKIPPENTQNIKNASKQTEHTLNSVVELLHDIMFEVKYLTYLSSTVLHQVNSRGQFRGQNNQRNYYRKYDRFDSVTNHYKGRKKNKNFQNHQYKSK